MDCGEAKPTDAFWRCSSRADGLQAACSDCSRRRKAQGLASLRAELFSLFGSACQRCGNADWRVLEVDHVGGGGTAERNARGAGGIRSTSRKLIAAVRTDLRAYQLLCANCHRIKTREDIDAARGFPEPEPLPPLDSAALSARRSDAGRLGALRRWGERSE